MSKFSVAILAALCVFPASIRGQLGPSQKTIQINGKECAFVNCPANCQLSFENGCPHNCNCDFAEIDEAGDNSTITGNATVSSGKHRSRCPKAICPQPFPKCLTLTGLDGCQKCSCEGKEKPPVGLSFEEQRSIDEANGGICSVENQFKLNVWLEWLYNQIYPYVSHGSIGIPGAFYIPRDKLWFPLCPDFRKTLETIGDSIVTTCLYKSERLATIYANLIVACDRKAQPQFFKYQECLDKVRVDILQCERESDYYVNPTNNQGQCVAFVPLNGCVYNTWVKKCGFEGWEVFYKISQLNLGIKFPACRWIYK